MKGIKHLIECHCYLAIYKKNEKMINHKFPVYSKLGEDGILIPKLVKCNNCEALHYVEKVGQSEIRAGKDQTDVVIKKEDISLMMPSALSNLLSNYNCDISSWEHANDVLTEKRWGEFIVLKRDIIDENEQVKILIINGKDKFKIETKIINNTIVR